MRRVTTLGIQLLLLSASFFSLTAFGHTIEGGDASFVEAIDGPAIGPFIYLGAKHTQGRWRIELFCRQIHLLSVRGVQMCSDCAGATQAASHFFTRTSRMKGITANEVNAYK